ncbi:MAG: PQQ-dependent sugar dehydrogenase [Flavitalea sp.]
MKSIALTISCFIILMAGRLDLKASDTIVIKKSAPAPLVITVPAGFSATTILDSLGTNRHIAVSSNGDIYVKVERPVNGKGIMVLRESGGKATIVNSFGTFAGSGIAIKNGYVYATTDDDVYRFKMNDKNEVAPNQEPEKIITGLVNKRQHAAKTIALDDAGNIYVNIGAPSNSCQIKDRENGSRGQDPCPILEQAGGIWKFKADKLNQTYKDGSRYATGIRNGVAVFWNKEQNSLYVMQHGRDGLFQMFPSLYNAEEGAELPAEEMLKVKEGANFGWPYCYYDEFQNKKILAPEYGGDKKKQGRCSIVDTPVVAFPGHWAPNAILFYTGDQFPAKYKNGAFVAFHGSWNRAPQNQKGYKVVFVPFANGKPSGNYEVFADGFAGSDALESPDDAVARPSGLAMAADGSLYISDDVKGKIWKISYAKK